MKRKVHLSSGIFGIAFLLLMLIPLLKHAKQSEAIEDADYIVQVSFTGLENMFNSTPEYYAIVGNAAEKVSLQMLPEDIQEEAENASIYDDTESDYWLVNLETHEDSESVSKDGWRESTLGKGMYTTWRNWTNSTSDPTAEDLDVFDRINNYLYNLDPDGWVWESGTDRGLVSYMAIKHDGNYLIEIERDGLYVPNSEGGLDKIMDCPEKGDISYYWFL